MERLRDWLRGVAVPRRLIALSGILLGTVGSCSLPKINPHL